MELYASYVYLSMATYFERDDVALHGFAKRFLENSHEEHDHAEKLIKYQNMRGGRVVFKPIAEPNVTEGEYLKEQVEAEKEISDLVTKMKRAGDGIGLHI